MTVLEKSSYHFRHRIEHANRALADKLSYFADVVEFFVQNQGTVMSSGLENHRSLLHKILFQLENWTNHSVRYVQHYFSHPYLRADDLIIRKHYSKEFGAIVRARNQCQKNQNYKDETSREILAATIRELLNHLESTLFDNAIKRIIKAILCPRPLSEEKHDHIAIFDYYTPLFMCEFSFAGFDLKNLRHIVDIISRAEVNEKEQSIGAATLLPPDLCKLRSNKEDFYAAAKEYLKNLNLKQQLDGMYFMIKTMRRSRGFVFRLVNAVSNDPFDYEYEGVRFFNQLDEKYRWIHKKRSDAFFDAKAFCEVFIIAGDEVTSLKKAELVIDDALRFFNAVFKLNARIDPREYLIIDDVENKYESHFEGVIDPQKIPRFENGKMSNYLQNVSTKLSDKIIKLDKIYFQAIMTPRPEDRLVQFWRYLESFFDYDDYDASEVHDIVSAVVARESLISYKINIHNLAWLVLAGRDWIGSHKYFEITQEEYQEHLNSKSIHEVDFQRLEKIIIHPSVSKDLAWYNRTSDSEKIETARQVWRKILLELYEHRNLMEHAGIHNEFTAIKLESLVGTLVQKFRDGIARGVRDSNETSFKGLLYLLAGKV